MAEHHWSPPRLNQTVVGEERRVGWLELFYDLVYVATLIQLGEALSNDVSVAGFVRFFVLFVPIWWTWSSVTFYMNRFVVDDVWHRLLITVQITAIAFLGVSIAGAFGELSTQFALAYVAMRIVLIVLYLRSWYSAPTSRPLARWLMPAYVVGVTLWLISAFVPMPWAIVLWVIALIIEIGAAFLPQTRQAIALLPPDQAHLRERYGIFVIIVLGESFIKTISAASGFAVTWGILYFSLLGIGAVVAIWWLYFDTAELTKIQPNERAMFTWIYAHLPLTLAITAFGVGAKKVFLEVGEAYVHAEYIALYAVSLTIYGAALLLINSTFRPMGSVGQQRLRFVSPILIIVTFATVTFWRDGWAATTFITLTAAVLFVAIIVEVLSTPAEHADAETTHGVPES